MKSINPHISFHRHRPAVHDRLEVIDDDPVLADAELCPSRAKLIVQAGEPKGPIFEREIAKKLVAGRSPGKPQPRRDRPRAIFKARDERLEKLQIEFPVETRPHADVGS